MMTKKERQMIEDLLTASALRSTSEVKPDLLHPGGTDKSIVGYLPVGECSDSAHVQHIESTLVTHREVGTSCGSQGGRDLYSTKLLALKALRWKVERVCATRLRRVDKMIETAEAEQGIEQ
jgi:hypothetical protein